MIKVNAAVRLSAASITASYEGTKSSDLVKYVKGLLPSLKVFKPGPGSKVKRPSFMSGTISAADAKTLGSKLKEEGWKAKKQKNPNTGTPMTSYVPSDVTSKYMPYVAMSEVGANDKVRVIVEHATAAAIRESRLLQKLNQTSSPTSKPPKVGGPRSL